MADKKIADLQEATTLSDTDIVIVEDNANTKKITWANLKTAIIGAFSSILGNRTYTEQNVVTNGESLTESIDALDVSFEAHKADITPKSLSITLNTTDWYANQTTAERVGKLVIVTAALYAIDVKSSLIVCSGLPALAIPGARFVGSNGLRFNLSNGSITAVGNTVAGTYYEFQISYIAS